MGVRHKNICGLLKKCRLVSIGNASADSCTPDLLVLLSTCPSYIPLSGEGEEEEEEERYKP